MPEIRPLLAKGLEALSVRETGELLSHLGFHSFLPSFKENSVSNAPLLCSSRLSLSHFTCVRSQIDGAALRGITPEELFEISPDATRVMIKMFLQSIRDLLTASQVWLQSYNGTNDHRTFAISFPCVHIRSAFQQITRVCSDNSTRGFPASSERPKPNRCIRMTKR